LNEICKDIILNVKERIYTQFLKQLRIASTYYTCIFVICISKQNKNISLLISKIHSFLILKEIINRSYSVTVDEIYTHLLFYEIKFRIGATQSNMTEKPRKSTADEPENLLASIQPAVEIVRLI
jgi:hypothetical protein